MNEALARTNYYYCQETIALKDTIEQSFLMLGERLAKIQDAKMYEPNYDNFWSFVKELKISSATASKLTNIYRKFIIEYDIDPEKVVGAGGWTVVAELLPSVTSKTNAEDWLRKAKSMPRSELRKELKEGKTGMVAEDCPHTDGYYLHICNECGLRERAYADKLLP